MVERTRRAFIADVGRGMLIASLGPAVAADLGLASAHADAVGQRLTFGAAEPLVSLMQDTPAEKLLPALQGALRSGTSLRELVGAAALANARTFGGQDYDGYHCFMALAPAYQMSRELPDKMQALPVFKVLYRNTKRMQDRGGSRHEILHPVSPASLSDPRDPVKELRAAVEHRDHDGAEKIFAAMAGAPIDEAYNQLQMIIQDEIDVHRVVLVWRSWAILDLAGQEQARTLLRQSVRFCVDSAENRAKTHRAPSPIRELLPKLLDQYHLLAHTPGTRRADAGWIESLSRTVYGAERVKAADAVAAALGEGFSPEDVGEAISLAANRLLLCDAGRKRAEPGKPVGSVHGASVGVHASDSANAWRNIARVSNHRNTYASLIVGAYHTAGQAAGQNAEPQPLGETLEKIQTTDAATLLRETAEAINTNNQAQACALVHRYGTLGHPERPVFDLLLRYAVSEDGALHAEKYYRTVSEEFLATRPAFRWRHLSALARVTASEFGHPAPGLAEAHRLIGV
jgi:hypothetical protein